MNWNEIKEKYPKSFNLLDKSVDIHWELEPERYQRLRFLYDFFDEQGIYIGVAFAREFGQGDYINYWVGVVDEKITDDDYRQDYWERFNSRIETEKAVFLKAFEILEEKLNE